jgi:hypothetical protein
MYLFGLIKIKILVPPLRPPARHVTLSTPPRDAGEVSLDPMDYGPRGVHGVQLLQRKGGARTHDHLLVRKWFGIPIFNTNILIENLSIFEKCLHHIIVRN